MSLACGFETKAVNLSYSQAHLPEPSLAQDNKNIAVHRLISHLNHVDTGNVNIELSNSVVM